jgi:hypothetical protein
MKQALHRLLARVVAVRAARRVAFVPIPARRFRCRRDVPAIIGNADKR